jgi:ATP-dependent exoDNAse (exonuclease V) alpha subunit
MGAALSAEQRRATEGICGSARGAELIVGVAGAGKTTLLQVVAAAFEASGCRVVGTATSGQAARTLGREAELGESRTLASLLWRLDHDRLALDERSVVILDEVGMTEDAHLIALTARIEAAGAKLVLVGDHHQLGAVGPGGALAALVRRHPDVVHQLTENRRQHDVAERRTLVELRDGDVAKAVAWYHDQGRLHAAADRDVALQQAVDAWAVDVAAGHHTGLYAWRRANVAALNQRARAWMDATGRLAGPELTCPGGHAYRAGDRVVTLGPGADGRLVTSQRAVITAVDLARPDPDVANRRRPAPARPQRRSRRRPPGLRVRHHRAPRSRIHHRAGSPLRRRRRPRAGLRGPVEGPGVHPRLDGG